MLLMFFVQTKLYKLPKVIYALWSGTTTFTNAVLNAIKTIKGQKFEEKFWDAANDPDQRQKLKEALSMLAVQ